MKYGITIDNLAKWRIVLADNEFETKKDIFRDYVEGTDIFLREVEEVRKVHKYAAWLGYWILERYNEGKHTPPNVYDYNRYECLYVFKKKDGSPQDELAWMPVEFLVNTVLTAQEDPLKRHNHFKDHAKKYMEAGEKEKQLFFEILDSEFPYQATMLDNQEAIVVPDMSNVVKGGDN
jgi:hypothetical protein